MKLRSACRTAIALLLLAACCAALPGSTAWAIDPDAGREREARTEERQGALDFLIAFFEGLWAQVVPRDPDGFTPTINASQTDATQVNTGPESGTSGEDPPDPDAGPNIDPNY